MRTLLYLITLQLFLSPLTNPALALYPRGPINDDLSYSDLEIIYICKKKGIPYTRPKKKKPRFISGCLNNRTGKAIYVKGTLFFNDFFNRPTAKAKIKKSIPAYGKACFRSPISLKKEKFSDFKLDWQINSPRKLKSVSKPAKPKKSSESSIRKLNNGLQITGRNSVTTDKFRLKKGLCSFRANIIGSRFKASLINKSTKKKRQILTQTGEYSRNEKINIEEEGFYTLRVVARDSWRVEVEFPQKPRLELKAGNNDPADSSVVYLKNGKTITAEQLSSTGNIVSIMSKGTTIRMDKENILKTEFSKDIEAQPVNHDSGTVIK